MKIKINENLQIEKYENTYRFVNEKRNKYLKIQNKKIIDLLYHLFKANETELIDRDDLAELIIVFCVTLIENGGNLNVKF